MSQEKINCPFCLREHEASVDYAKHLTYFGCLGGYFAMDLDYYERHFLPEECKKDPNKKEIYNALLRQRAVQVVDASLELPRFAPAPILDYEDVFQHDQLPNPAEQADKMLLYLGDKTKYPGKKFEFNCDPQYARSEDYQKRALLMGASGVIDNDNLYMVLGYLLDEKFLYGSKYPKTSIFLMQKGWKRYAELQRPNKESKYVFLAMKFEKDQQDFLKEKLSPMLKDLGLELRLLPEILSQENLIDTKLRVAIRQSRLLICDLTHGNQGAYWEAGYAEGLKLPVIYICEKDVLDGKSPSNPKPHFDVNHQNIFTWKKDDKESIKKFVSDVQAQIQMFL